MVEREYVLGSESPGLNLDLNLDSEDTGHMVSSNLSSLICNNDSRLAHLLGLLVRFRQMTTNTFCTNNYS